MEYVGNFVLVQRGQGYLFGKVYNIDPRPELNMNLLQAHVIDVMNDDLESAVQKFTSIERMEREHSALVQQGMVLGESPRGPREVTLRASEVLKVVSAKTLQLS